MRGRAQVGSIELIVCSDGTSLFDGGAMFGVVPKTMWEKKSPSDDRNRITIGLNCVVVKTGGRTLLIETGFGNKLTPKLREIYGSQQKLPHSLAAAGITPENIDIIINTHLHWDHSGWNTTQLQDGSVVPTFPNATYLTHGGEVRHGRKRLERDRISYVPENYEPLMANGQMLPVEDCDFIETKLAGGGTAKLCRVAEGVSLELFPGHTHQLMAVHMESGGEHACFVSDLIPTSAHLDVSWAMAFDLDPLRTIEERKRFYARCLAEDWTVLFPHDHRVPIARLEEIDGRVQLRP